MQNYSTKIFAGGFALLLLAGCKRDEIQTYRIAKDQTPPPIQAGAMTNSTLPPGHPDISGATAQTEMPPALPPGHPALPGTSLGSQNFLVPNASTTISHEGQPNWTVPSDWKEISGGQFLVAKFLLNDGAAAVNVSSSAGDGGGLAANVNRWRGQLGLAPLSDEEDFSKSVASLDVAGGKASLVDFTGTNAQTGQPAEIVGTMISQSDRAWFYKLMGDPKIVAAQKDAFVKFVQSAKY